MTEKRVMKLNEFENAIYYRASCSCGEPKCDLTIELEKDEGLPDMIFLNMYKNLYWSSYWQSDNFFKNAWIRIKGAFKMLFTGYVKVEESFIFQGDKQIDAFLNALKEGRDYLNNTPG
jgi:hypothetical protein